MNLSRRTRLAKLEDASDAGQQAVVIQVVYDGYLDQPPSVGERYTLYLPQKAPSVAAWYQSTARFRQAPLDRSPGQAWIVKEGGPDEVA